MTDPVSERDEDIAHPDPDNEVLEDLKDAARSADDNDVHDGIGGRPRLTWSSVTDAGGTTADRQTGASDDEEPARSSFHFDLGGALARLAGDEAAPVASPPRQPEPRSESVARAPEPLPVRDPEPLPTRAPEPMPTRQDPLTQSVDARSAPANPEPLAVEPVTPVTPVSPESESPTFQYPRRVPGTHLESEMRDASPEMPEIRAASPIESNTRHAVRTSVFDDGTGARSGGVPGAPSLPGSPAAGALPVLPAANPAAPPAIVEPISGAPSTPDIAALRSAQLKASKQQRQGKLFGRSLLAFVLIGGLIAAALVFGRSLLFDTEWDAQLTPIVNEVEAARGVGFDHTVPLDVVPAAELGDRLRTATIGDAWVDRVPEWRALGLATGTVDAGSVASALAASTSAVYDPRADRIYLMDGVDPQTAARDLRVALEDAYDAQRGLAPAAPEPAVGTGGGFTGVSSLESIATRAVDEVLASGGAVRERQPANETLPFPIAYELAAIDVLGEPILAAAGVDPATLTIGRPYPPEITGALDDRPTTAASVLIRPGEVSITPPVALGNDDWSLAWGARLPETTVARLVEQVTADSYRPVDRGGTVCFVSVFETADEAAGSSVFAAMLSWAANSPAGAQAIATQLSPTRVQLEGCDPGADAGLAPNAGVVDALIDRQQLRLTN